MAKHTKRSLIQAKIQMDARVQELRGIIARGTESAQRLPAITEQYQATQRYLRSSCMYETPHYEEGEKTPEDLEREIESLERNIGRADSARAELANSARFYRAYHWVVNGPKIRELKKHLTAVEYWVEQYRDQIAAIDFDTDKDIDERMREKEIMEYQHAQAKEQVQQIQSKIKEIQNIKYM